MMTTDLSGIEIVHPLVAQILRTKSGAERLRLAHETWELTRERLRAYLTARHPDWSTERVGQEVARRLLHDAG